MNSSASSLVKKMERIKQFAMFQTEGSAYDGFHLVLVYNKDGEPLGNPWLDFNANELTDAQAIEEYGEDAFNEFVTKASAILDFVDKLNKEVSE